MFFRLTSDYVVGLLNEAARNPGPLIEALDPRVGSKSKDDVAKTGSFV